MRCVDTVGAVTVMRQQTWSTMDDEVRAALMHRGLDDIFDSELRHSIGLRVKPVASTRACALPFVRPIGFVAKRLASRKATRRRRRGAHIAEATTIISTQEVREQHVRVRIVTAAGLQEH